ncbi:hypothetical protein MC885_001220 [Smutsia gigantea]|nr:hypothetical protein MC885_001220 [Smutsia gigantea]
MPFPLQFLQSFLIKTGPPMRYERHRPSGSPCGAGTAGAETMETLQPQTPESKFLASWSWVLLGTLRLPPCRCPWAAACSMPSPHPTSPMQLLWLLSLWMLEATGALSSAMSIPAGLFLSADAARTAPSNPTVSRGRAGWPLSISQIDYPTPGSRENTPQKRLTSPQFEPLSETLLKTTNSSSSSANPTSKIVIKVGTSPPTLVMYTSSTECINPTNLILTTTYPTTTCNTPTSLSYTTSMLLSSTTAPTTEKQSSETPYVHPIHRYYRHAYNNPDNHDHPTQGFDRPIDHYD